MVSSCAKWLESVRATLIKSAERMTAPRVREQRRLTPRRGGRPPSQTVSAAAALARLAGSARALAAAALLAITGALALPATAEAQTATTLVSNFGQGGSTSGTSPHPSRTFCHGAGRRARSQISHRRGTGRFPRSRQARRPG